ncbi:MAG: hypothetical protein BWX87_00525 [Bacteroidetes bacterium ADurb.Bin123]|nr:MAG: hypothetical protein BWX87_00525 [Bacteroidetes bacterium ADurb.Bin123]
MKRISFKNIQILKLTGKILTVAGVFFVLALFLAFTTLPFWGLHWLGTSLSKPDRVPAHIILLGGSGMPSESNLIRGWYAACAAEAIPASRIVIVMPGDTSDFEGTPRKMERELAIRGIAGERILFESTGTNTRSQALACAALLGTNLPVMLVTSPENMRRSILCFRKAGFAEANALPAFDNPSEADFSFRDDDLGSAPPLVPDVGNNFQIRYQVWTHLKYEVMIVREFMALAYYRLRGWI